jgi:hypothetical protein
MADDFTPSQQRQINQFLIDHEHRLQEMLTNLIIDNAAIFGGGAGGSAVAMERKKKRAEKEALKQTEQSTEANKDNEKSTKKNTDSVDDNTDGQKRNTKSKSDNTKAVEEHTGIMKDAKDEWQSWTRRMASVGTIIGGVTQAMNDAKAAMARGAALDPLDALSMGITAQDLVDLQSTYRQTALAAKGGTDEFTSSLRTMSHELYARTGDFRAAAYLAADIKDVSQSIGVSYGELSDGVIPGLIKGFKNLQNMTGMTADQYGTLLKDMVNDHDVKQQLLRMSDVERARYPMELQKQMEYFAQLGYSTEQIKEFSKRIAKTANEDPLERIKQAAKLRAIGGAHGMSPEANRLAELIIKGQHRTIEENMEMETLRSDVAGAINQSLGKGLGQEIFSSAMLRKTGLGDLFANADQSIQLGKNINQEALANQEQFIKGTFGPATVRFTKAVDLFENAVKSAIGMLAIGGALRGIGLMKSIKSKGGTLGGFLKEKGSSFFKGAPVAEGAAGAGGAKGAGVGKYLKGGAKGGLLGIAGGLTAGVLIDNSSMKQENKDSANTVVTSAMIGATVGSFVPVVGTALGAALGTVAGVGIEAFDRLNDSAKELHERRLRNLDEEHKEVMAGLIEPVNENASMLLNYQKQASDTQLQIDQANAIQDRIRNLQGLTAQTHATRNGAPIGIDNMDIAEALGFDSVSDVNFKKMYETHLNDMFKADGKFTTSEKNQASRLIEGREKISGNQARELLASMTEALKERETAQRDAATKAAEKNANALEKLVKVLEGSEKSDDRKLAKQANRALIDMVNMQRAGYEEQGFFSKLFSDRSKQGTSVAGDTDF